VHLNPTESSNSADRLAVFDRVAIETAARSFDARHHQRLLLLKERMPDREICGRHTAGSTEGFE